MKAEFLLLYFKTELNSDAFFEFYRETFFIILWNLFKH